MISTSQNIERNVWRRVRRNKSAMFGIVIIVIAIFVAIFCYFIAVDSTPNANRMVVEIAATKPGHSQQYLKIAAATKTNDGFFKTLINGRTDPSVFIPIVGYRINGDSVEIDKFIGKGISEKQMYYFADKKQYEIVKVNYWLGTDKYGRDILSRLLVGVRVSLAVGLITVLISLTIGVTLGALAGYFRGWVDDVIMWLINVIWSIPTLLLVFATTLVLGKGFWQVFIAIGLTMWVGVARIIRGQVLSVREMDYVEAARALGYKNSRIIFRHILPNVMGPVLVISASGFATAIVIEAGLSFLGVGVQPPQPSWGLMIKENYNFIITHNPALALAPGIAIMLLVLAFNLLGNGLRDALEVRN